MKLIDAEKFELNFELDYGRLGTEFGYQLMVDIFGEPVKQLKGMGLYQTKCGKKIQVTYRRLIEH